MTLISSTILVIVLPFFPTSSLDLRLNFFALQFVGSIALGFFPGLTEKVWNFGLSCGFSFFLVSSRSRFPFLSGEFQIQKRQQQLTPVLHRTQDAADLKGVSSVIDLELIVAATTFEQIARISLALTTSVKHTDGRVAIGTRIDEFSINLEHETFYIFSQKRGLS